MVSEKTAVGLPAPQPELRQVLKTAVLPDLPGADMAVVVHEGQPLGIVVEKMPGSLRFQKEIPVHKGLHIPLPFRPGAFRSKAP